MDIIDMNKNIIYRHARIIPIVQAGVSSRIGKTLYYLMIYFLFIFLIIIYTEMEILKHNYYTHNEDNFEIDLAEKIP
jgi:hypothetical protein